MKEENKTSIENAENEMELNFNNLNMVSGGKREYLNEEEQLKDPLRGNFDSKK